MRSSNIDDVVRRIKIKFLNDLFELSSTENFLDDRLHPLRKICSDG